MEYRRAGDGRAFYALGATSGKVIFFPLKGVPFPVFAGRELNTRVTINPTIQAMECDPVTSTSISADAKQAIEQQVDLAFKALCTTTFSEPDH